MDKKQIAKLATAATIMTGMAIALPAVTPFVAPFLLPLVTGMLSDKVTEKLGESSVNAVTGILGNLAASAIWESPTSFAKSPENHDLLKLLATAYSKAIDELLTEIENNPEDNKNYGAMARLVLPEIKKEIDNSLKPKPTKTLDELFPSKEYLEAQKAIEAKPQKVPFYLKLFGYSPKAEVPISEKLASKLSSEDFILSISENPEASKEILAHEVEISLRRWFAETTPSVAEFPEHLTPFVFERLAEIIPKYVGTLIKEAGFEKSWLAFQRSHLQAILKEVRNNKNGLSEEDRELLRPLAEKLDELAKSDFPQQLADSTSTILSRLDESEENIKQCVKEETTKLQDYLVGMESRIRGDIGEAKTEIIDEIHKISLEQPLPNSIQQSVGFVGREDDYLKKIREQYQNGCRAFVFHGIGGIGKTALALEFAGEIKDAYRAKTFVRMEGLTKPLSARDAMFDIVKQFGAEIPPDVSASQLENVFVSTVQEQPTLIVLDNAKNEDSVKSLINADDACFIITSRQRIYLGEETFEILKMSEKDAAAFLSDKGGEQRFGDFVDDMAKECGYLPLALEIIKGLLMTKRLMRIDDFLEKFKKEKMRYLDEVTTSLNLSYEMIGEKLQSHWRQLAVFPADFDADACAAVWKVEPETAEAILEELDSYSLIEVNLETQRFNLHDLVRAFCDKKLADNERFDIRFSFAEHYASILWKAQSIKENDRQNGFVNALKLVDTEWTNILAGQKWSAENLEKNNEIAEICRDYSGAFREIDLRLRPRDDILWLNAGLKACQQIGNRQGEGTRVGNLGIAYGRLGESRKAIDFSEQALEISREIGDRQNECNWLGNLGNAYSILGESRKAIGFYEQALEISREIGNRQGEGNSLGSLGSAYLRLGEYKKAIEYHEQALQISKEIGNHQGEGNWLGNLGIAYKNLGEYKKAIEYHEQALQISKEIGDRQGEGNSLGNLGIAYLNLGEYKKAIDYCEQALQISREIGDRQGEGNWLANLGLAYFSLGEKEKACGLWKEALAILEAIESPDANVVRQWIEKAGCN